MKNIDDWMLRIKGKHSLTIYRNGMVIYSVGKQKLFILKKYSLQNIESLVKMHSKSNIESEIGNILRYNDGKKIYDICNIELYTQLWKLIFAETSMKGKIDEVVGLTSDIEYTINYGDLLSDDFLPEIDDNVLNKFLSIDIYTDALINIILTKDSKIYYERKK